MAASVNNYFIGKGVALFRAAGETNWRDMGNAPSVSITPEIEELEHRSSRAGTSSVDRTIVISKAATLALVLDEITKENLAIALLGEVGTDGSLSIFSKNSIEGEFRLVGTNDVGVKYQLDLPSVNFIPSGEVGFITDEFGQLELSGKIGVQEDGSFGSIKTPPDTIPVGTV